MAVSPRSEQVVANRQTPKNGQGYLGLYICLPTTFKCTLDPGRGRVALVISEWYNVEQAKKSTISAIFMGPIGCAIDISTGYIRDITSPD